MTPNYIIKLRNGVVVAELIQLTMGSLLIGMWMEGD